MDVISLFSGCGGLDIGFNEAGFNVVWANEYDAKIWPTYRENHRHTHLDTRSISKIPSCDIPESIGIIGGPPCQSWSTAGLGKGFADPRGKLFHEFIRVINDKNPLFFLAENVEGMLNKRHADAFETIKSSLESAGKEYNVSVALLNAANYNVPQNRKRVFFVGYRKDLKKTFEFPKPSNEIITAKMALADLIQTAIPARNFNQTNGEDCIIPNHEYWQGGFSYIFMSRNRVLDWDKPSFTMQANGRQMSIHPQASPMIKVAKDVMIFDPNSEGSYRRLTVRECARIQTFPDSFKLVYNSVDAGYRMLGNAVPVNLAKAIADKIYLDLVQLLPIEDICHIASKQPQLAQS